MSREKRIREGERVPVRFNASEVRLLELTQWDPDYCRRLEPDHEGEILTGRFSLDELDDMIGFMAAEANHTEDRRVQRQLDKLMQRLRTEMESYDDGNWQFDF